MRKFIIILLFVLFIPISGCLKDGNNNHTDKNIYSKYFIKTGTYSSSLISEENISIEYEIIVPIIVLEDSENSKINDLLEVKGGNPTYEVIMTEYGYGLSIHAKGSIWIEFENEERYDIPLPDENDNALQNPKVKMSLKGDVVDQSQGKHNFWIYFNGSVDIFAFSVYSNFDNCGNLMQFNIDNDDLRINDGWNQYLATYTPTGGYDD